MEDTCHYNCSRGVLKSCFFHSQSPKSSCDNDIGYLVEMLKSEKMFNGMSIYVCSNLLRFFVRHILSKIVCKFVLVSGDSDMTVPHDALTPDETNTLFSNIYMIRWYAQNSNHPLIQQLPIGLDYHTISNNPNHYWRQQYEPHLPIEQEKILCQVRDNTKKRHDTIFVNFTMDNDRFGQRRSALTNIETNLLTICKEKLPRTAIWNLMANHTFVLSPFGMGMDCHRTWEALCLGCIPIIMSDTIQPMFDELPVLIVNDWRELNEKLLTDTANKFKSCRFNFDKLTLNYWIGKINF